MHSGRGGWVDPVPLFEKGEGMSEFYIMQVETMTGEKIGTARLYFSVVPSVARDYFYSSDGYTIIQEQYKAATGYDLDVNSSYGFSAAAPVDLTACSGWNVYLQNNFTHRFDITSLTQTLKYIFKNGSYITIDPPIPLPSDSHEIYSDVSYYTKTGTLVLTTNLSARVFNEYLGTFESCAIKEFPWKGVVEGNYYRFVAPVFTASGGSNNFLSLTLSTIYVDKTLADQFFNGTGDPDDPNDPYPDDDSGPDNPDDPDGIPEPDDIDFPDDPDIDVTEIGFVTLYAPTKAQLVALSSYMWSGLFDIATLKKLFADPMDCILGLNLLPFSVPRSDLQHVSIGNIDTGISMYVAEKQWVTIDCGTVNIGSVYDTYLDYAPYTKIHIYLPFIGLQELNVDDVAHKAIRVKYKIDILSCACIAFISADDRVLYQFSGACGYSVPISSTNYSALFGSAVDVAISTAMLVSTAGAAVPATAREAAVHEARMVAQTAGAVSSSANAVMNSKPTIKRSGSLGGGSGIIGIQKPYIIFEIPRICKPARQQHFIGYPSFITIQVSGISGYAEFESIILNGVTCTEEERTMLADIFKGGVYV